MLKQKIKFKDKEGRRFLIEVRDNTHAAVISLGFYAYDVAMPNSPSVEFYFGITDSLMVTWHLEDRTLLYNFLTKRGLELVKHKIESRNYEKEIITLNNYNAGGSFPYKVVRNNDIEVDTPEDKFKKNHALQKTILGYLYMKDERGATSKEIIEESWCDEDALISNLFFLDKKELISWGHFTKEEALRCGEDNSDLNRLTFITATGKDAFEAMKKEDFFEFKEQMNFFSGWVPFASNKTIFLAHKFSENELISQVKEELTNAGFEFAEGKVTDLGYITDDILCKIKNSGFFLALLTSVYELKEGGFSTAPWVLMEMGAAIAFGRKVLILAEDSIEQEEYSGKLQRDCQYEIFQRQFLRDKLAIVIQRIQNEWDKNKGIKN